MIEVLIVLAQWGLGLVAIIAVAAVLSLIIITFVCPYEPWSTIRGILIGIFLIAAVIGGLSFGVWSVGNFVWDSLATKEPR